MGRGGKREGAGRKAGGRYGEPTQLVRIPVSKLEDIQVWLSSLRQAQVDVMTPVEMGESVSIPLYSSKVRAGFPSPADDYIENQLDMNEYLVRNPSSTFLLKVQGDSMIDAGIHEGDVLVVDRSMEVADGRIVIAAINGELTVKTLIKKPNGVVLRAENADYPDIEVSEENDLVIWGVVSSIVRKL